jgi:hypothetical protein
MQAKLLPQRLPPCLALLEACEELIEEADDYGIDADAFGLGPVFEFGASLSAHVEELGIGQFHSSFAGLLNLDRVIVHVVQSIEDDPGQIAFYAGLFGDGFAEIERKAQRHAWPIIRPALPLTVHLARYRLSDDPFGYFLDSHWHLFQIHCDDEEIDAVDFEALNPV